MTIQAALKISYWALPIEGDTFEDFAGIEDFRSQLSQSYLSVIRPRRGECGGLYDLTVELISQVALKDVVLWLLSGISFDLLKSGSQSFILKPFLAAYSELKQKNLEKRFDIEVLRLVFQDSTLVIHQIRGEGIFPNLEKILLSVAKNYKCMALPSGEPPSEIVVPIFEDVSPTKLCRFRVMLEVDETIEDISDRDYFKWWGLYYDESGQYRVFKVEEQLLIDSHYYNQEEYWKAWHQKQQTWTLE